LASVGQDAVHLFPASIPQHTVSSISTHSQRRPQCAVQDQHCYAVCVLSYALGVQHSLTRA
jgi:hypothetical protein